MSQPTNPSLQDLSVVYRLCFAARTLPAGSPNYWDIVAKFSIKHKQQYSLTEKEARIFVQNLQMCNSDVFTAESKLTRELTKLPKNDSSEPEKIGVILLSPIENCILCKSKLFIRHDRSVQATLYDSAFGSVPAIHYTRYCRKKGCSLQQHYGYYTKGVSSEITYNYDALSLSYFMCSRESAFSMEILKKFDSECLIGQISYKQCAEIFNNYHGYESDTNQTECEALLTKRLKMDRRRLEDAHFRFAMLNVVQWYSSDLDFTEIAFSSDISETFLQFTPKFQKLFYSKYSGHRCSKKGCGRVLVVDGNMKNHRSVCAASEAGFMEYAGLPGTVKTGCTNTPCQKSRFCNLHKPRTLSTETARPNSVIEMILEKKTTRSQTMYKVLWLGMEDCKVTWEKETAIPKSILEEYATDALVDIQKLTTRSMGHTAHTLSVTTREKNPEPDSKKQKSDRITVQCDSGVFAANPNDISCNTVKEKKVQLHERSAGLLAGIWPCGIITMVDELFSSESLSQVYGCLHTLLHTNATNTEDINIICYDDGCHLRKYCRNPVRASLSEAAAKVAAINIVIDKLHFKGHIDPWCHANCNPYEVADLKEVDTEICEQTFSWFSRYARMTRYMNKAHYLFYILYICELHNRRVGLAK